jgi:hypothetical protein
VNDRLFPSALREVRDDLTKRPVIVGMIALGVILGISGPFNTLDVIPAAPRILYWVTVVFLTFATGSLVSTITHELFNSHKAWIGILASTIAIGLAVTCVLCLLNGVLFGQWYASLSAFMNQLGIVTAISGVIELGSFAVRTGSTASSVASVPLMERLPMDKRGALVGLAAEDHYVRVTTINGEELVLLRLSDALNEVGATKGLQIHRSHWVALDQVTQVTRIADRGQVTLSDGTTRPISRGFMPSVREAGLLPKRRAK